MLINNIEFIKEIGKNITFISNNFLQYRRKLRFLHFDLDDIKDVWREKTNPLDMIYEYTVSRNRRVLRPGVDQVSEGLCAGRVLGHGEAGGQVAAVNISHDEGEDEPRRQHHPRRASPWQLSRDGLVDQRPHHQLHHQPRLGALFFAFGLYLLKCIGIVNLILMVLSPYSSEQLGGSSSSRGPRMTSGIIRPCNYM